MMRALALCVAAVFLSSLSQLKADEPANTSSAAAKESRPMLGNMPLQNDTEIWRCARIVTDLAAFDLLKISSQKTCAWIVARVRPGEMSGTAHSQASYIQAETGKVIDSGIRPKIVILAGGQWELIELLSGQAPREGRYQWKEQPPNFFDRNLSMLDLFSVFQGAKNNGMVICQFFENKSGAEQFSNITSIPDGWNAFVKPAQEYYAQHAADFAGRDSNELRKLALSDSPFIGIAAISQLLAQTTEEKDSELLVNFAHSLPKYRQAVFISGLLNRNDKKSTDLVLKTISRANNTAELPGMALGVYAWSVSQGRQIAPEPVRLLHDKLMERWRSFDPAVVEDEFWNKILLAPGIQKDKSIQLNE